MSNSNYHEYDEFLDLLVKSGPFDLSIFGIECPMEDIITKLEHLTTKLLFFYDKNKKTNVTSSLKKNNQLSPQSFYSFSELKDYVKKLWGSD